MTASYVIAFAIGLVATVMILAAQRPRTTRQERDLFAERARTETDPARRAAWRMLADREEDQ
ncbi:hypothetical protein [Streptomyces sp. NPDC001054]